MRGQKKKINPMREALKHEISRYMASMAVHNKQAVLGRVLRGGIRDKDFLEPLERYLIYNPSVFGYNKLPASELAQIERELLLLNYLTLKNN